MNLTIVSGRVSKELAVKGKTGHFTLANDRDYPFNKDQNGNKVSNYITVKVLGEKNIDRAQTYLKKGTAIIVTGHYFRDTWKDNNGNYQEFNYVLCNKWEFQIAKANEDNSSPVSNESNQQVTNNNTHTDNNNPPPAPDDFMNIDSDSILDDLPFK